MITCKEQAILGTDSNGDSQAEGHDAYYNDVVAWQFAKKCLFKCQFCLFVQF